MKMRDAGVVRIAPPLQKVLRDQALQHPAEVAGRQTAGIGGGPGRRPGVPSDEPHHADLDRSAGPRLQIRRRRELPRHRVDEIDQIVKLRGLRLVHRPRSLYYEIAIS